jgi:H+/Cl- antiporter ClcA
MNQTIRNDFTALLLFGSTWYFFMMISAGLFIPGGLFVPAMIVGCCIGSLTNALK